jgi:uncharacterized membrane protein HdeD (DUF308 family)
MVAKIGLTMKAITVIFGLWVLITGIVLLFAGIEHRKIGALGWIMLLGGILSVIAGVVIIFDMATGAAWISTLLGIQALHRRYWIHSSCIHQTKSCEENKEFIRLISLCVLGFMCILCESS